MVDDKPLETFFLSDVKLVDADVSEKETPLYGKFASIPRDRTSKEVVMVLGLAATTRSASLWLYLMANKREWAIPIITGVYPWDNLLSTLYVANRYLAAHPVYYKVLQSQEPFKDGDNYRALKVGLRNRTFHQKVQNNVVKIFDRDDDTYSANVELLEVAGIGVSRHDLSCDGRFFYLMYPYYNGNHTPSNLLQFRGIFEMYTKRDMSMQISEFVTLFSMKMGKIATW